MGKPIPDTIGKQREASWAGRGLDLPHGPDVRSFNPAVGSVAAAMRGVLGMPEWFLLDRC